PAPAGGAGSPSEVAGRRLSGGLRTELRNAGGDSRLRAAGRGRRRHEHGSGSDRGAAMRSGGGGGVVHHQPGGGQGQPAPFASRCARPSRAGPSKGGAVAEGLCETLRAGGKILVETSGVKK